MLERNIEQEEVNALLSAEQGVRVLDNGDGTRTIFRGALRVVYDTFTETVITAYRRPSYKKRLKKCRQAKRRVKRAEKRQTKWIDG